ncbi:MAG TPA: hypothetical protein ENK18_07280 [Deltaproteobacteria bacterium]|nr:hypothetical protein [Deltaproteobacteria bacterium]
MRTCALLTALTLGGCATQIQLELPATPAVHLPAHAVAVIARDRHCQQTADTLAQRLGRVEALRVDPRAETHLELFACGDDQSWTRQEIASDEAARVRRRTTVVAHAYAVVAVIHRGRVLAHLIGSGSQDLDTAGQQRGSAALGRSAGGLAIQDLVEDLTLQIDPLPTLVERRVYPNAPDGTARALTTRAVEAERSGDLAEALRWAEAAWEQQPTPRTAGYLAELHRRRWAQ